ncbi:MAG: riboflavin synthase [Elusimicrobiota bacterium]
MFTGIVEELGQVTGTEPGVLHVRTGLQGIKKGDSISVNGVCLTVRSLSPASKDQTSVSFDASPETTGRTSLKILKTGEKVNLERAMSAQGRFGGHIMTGHVEQTGALKHVKKSGNSLIAVFSVPKDILKYIVPKGSVGVDGISLTVVDKTDGGFSVALIPHTLENTALKYRKPGDPVNLEPDILAKYVENMMQSGCLKTDDITEEYLKENGF